MGEVVQLPVVEPITFELFWYFYPKKQAKKVALVSWNRIAPEHYPAIMKAVAQFKKSDDWHRDGGRYIPMPATFLNQERWTDEFEVDLGLGQCCYNMHGNRSDEPRCKERATMEKRGMGYCNRHGERA